MENYQETEGNKTLWIIGGIVLVIAVAGVIYGITRKTANQEANVNDAIVEETKDSQVKGDAVAVDYTGFDVVNLQTFPHQVQVRVKGTVPEGCIVANKPVVTVSGKTFTVTMDGTRPAGAVCTQVVTPVEGVVNLPVSGAVAGTYTVKVDDLAAKTFTLATNNTVQYTGDK